MSTLINSFRLKTNGKALKRDVADVQRVVEKLQKEAVVYILVFQTSKILPAHPNQNNKFHVERKNRRRIKTRPKAVREMFSGIARRYDFLNHFLSVNIDKRWRRLVSPKSLQDVLEISRSARSRRRLRNGRFVAGTAKSRQRRKSSGRIFAARCSPSLKKKIEKITTSIPYIEGDGMNLSFADNTFDAVTIAFGLRNFSNWQDGLNELHRDLETGRKTGDSRIFHARRAGLSNKLFNFYFSQLSAAHRRRGQRLARRV